MNLLTDRRIAIGISRGSPEQARRGWEAFGYTGGSDERGIDVAHSHTAQFLDAVRGVPQADLDTSNGMAPGASARLRIEPHVLDVDRRLWWGAGIEQTARAKSEIITGLELGGWAVLNADDPACRAMRDATVARVAWFGEGDLPEGDLKVAARDVVCDESARAAFALAVTRESETVSAPVSLRVIGRHSLDRKSVV